MARGWESKAVEEQKDTAETKKERPWIKALTPEESERQRQREGLELSRTRVLHDLENATNPRYRASLEAGLKFLEQKIAALK
jgi:hypothetical protein